MGPSVLNETVPYNPDAGPGIGLDGKPLLDGTPSVNPIVTGPQGIASVGFDDQFGGLNDRLNKIEEGIASLLGNRGQGLNMGYQPYQPYQPSSNFNYMSMPSVFPPYGGMFG